MYIILVQLSFINTLYITMYNTVKYKLKRVLNAQSLSDSAGAGDAGGERGAAGGTAGGGGATAGPGAPRDQRPPHTRSHARAAGAQWLPAREGAARQRRMDPARDHRGAVFTARSCTYLRTTLTTCCNGYR